MTTVLRTRRRPAAFALLLTAALTAASAATGIVAAPARAADSPGTTQTRGGASVTVSKTSDLTRERITVSWRGFAPSAALSGNDSTRYRVAGGVVVMQCRGTDPATIDRRDCWARSTSDFMGALDSEESDPGVRYRVVDGQVVNPLADPSNPSPEGIPFRTLDGSTKTTDGMYRRTETEPDDSPLTRNSIWGGTRADGTGTVKFTVNTSAENPALGCGRDAQCSLVVVPLVGQWDCPRAADGSLALPDPDGRLADSYCSDTMRTFQNSSGVGALEWSLASNWKQRYVFPLTFLPDASRCPERKDRARFVGSENLAQAMRQWLPARCEATTGALDYTNTAEPDARRLFGEASATSASGKLVDAALTTFALGGDAADRAPAYAPVGLSGFAVAYNLTVSSGTERGKRITDLVLNARLLAKLLTQSYRLGELGPAGKDFTEDPNNAGNPADLTYDPELLALNPQIPRLTTSPRARLAAVGQVNLSIASSDIWTQLTSYLAADKDAVAFLGGAPDPWGMTVNKAWKGWVGATDTYTLRDDFAYNRDQLLQGNGTPREGGIWIGVPVLGQKANLGGSWREAAEAAMVSWPLNRGTVSDTAPYRFQRAPQGNLNDGADLALTTAAEAARRDLSTAQLVNPVSGKPVAADADGMRKALDGITPSGDLWVLDPAKMQGDAYPGTMITYAATATTGLSKPLASGLAQQIRWMSTEGQRPGVRAGTLPDGYVPLTDALAQQAARVADAVEAQAGMVPKPPAGQDAAGGSKGSKGSKDGKSATQGGSATAPPGTTAADPALAPPAAAGAPAAPGAAAPGTEAAIALTSAEQLGWLGWGLPAVLLIALLAGVSAPIGRLVADGRLRVSRPAPTALVAGLRRWTARRPVPRRRRRP